MRKQELLTVRTAQDGIADVLRTDITRGRIEPGAALRQEDLAERFGVSRIPVREALRRLESEGLVQVFPNRGAFVVVLSALEITEITDMRILLEGDLVHRSVTQATTADVERIKKALATAKVMSGTEGWLEADRDFHQELYRPARRLRQLEVVMNLRSAVEGYEVLYRKLPEKRSRWLRDHLDIFEALVGRDPESARSCIAAHVRAAGEFLLRRHGDRAAK